ncbi:Uncharacterised protein [Yersinia aldovae]|uniref:DUF7716 domain-containing protein n=1 Tax=Yersinia aldovae TaxID=29483 RepID=UPI0005E2AB3C|nr:hypothetical protein [Yersinia aldovae]CNH96592.1 Uncharacterised protein [Yersinia aldovae]
MELVTIREFLTHPENYLTGWFYLPPDKSKWNLDTQGVFSLDSSDFPPDSDDYVPIQVENDGWVETLDGASVEDIIDNVGYQLGDPKIEQLFEAFIFHYENDAFIEF